MKITPQSPINLAKAMGKAAVAAVTGQDLLVPDEVQAERKTVCMKCPQLDKEIEQCLSCTCFLYLKTPLATEACPLGKWGTWSTPIPNENSESQ